MIFEDLKKANIESMKSKNTNLHNIYSVLINKCMLAGIEARANGKDLTDDDTVHIIIKTIKELEEEAENYKKVNNESEANNINLQKQALESYLPKMLSSEEIKKVIDSLPDKSVPTVMRYFKTNYGSKVDYKLVGEVLKTIA